MAVPAIRSDIRSRGRAARRAVTAQQRQGAERSLIDHLRSVAALHVRSVGVFIAHDGEPDLMPLMSWLWERDITIALPVLEDDPDDFSMQFVPWVKGEALATGRYGIPVPGAVPPIEPETLLVSFTGFDQTGNRIGRGAGFFDRYLAVYSGTVIGVGFEVQRFDRVPVEDHDQPLPTIVTDLGVRFLGASAGLLT